MAEVVLEDVVKVYGEDVVAVQDMNLDIPDGEFVVFVGPSGCGKSTALRMIAGLEDISAGSISIGETVVNDLPPRDRDIAMVFQNYALYPHMNVRENMGFALKLKKMNKSEIAKKVDEAAKILGIEHFLDRKPKALSGGQRQRVALGRAIVREPKAFLMDEPLSNLDAKLRVQMRTEIAKLHNRLSTTTIYVTHDQTEAMTMADRIVVLKDGVVQQVDAPQEMYQRPENVFVAGFIGSPAMNFMRARLERDQDTGSGLAAVFGNTRLPLTEKAVAEAGGSGTGRELGSYVGEEVVLGIRPEHIEDASLTGGSGTRATNTMEVSPQVIESMGSEKYVYFEVGRDQAAHTRSMEALVEGGRDEEESSGTTSFEELMVARVSAESGVKHGEKLLLEVDASKVSLFDPETEAAVL